MHKWPKERAVWNLPKIYMEKCVEILLQSQGICFASFHMFSKCLLSQYIWAPGLKKKFFKKTVERKLKRIDMILAKNNFTNFTEKNA